MPDAPKAEVLEVSFELRQEHLLAFYKQSGTRLKTAGASFKSGIISSIIPFIPVGLAVGLLPFAIFFMFGRIEVMDDTVGGAAAITLSLCATFLGFASFLAQSAKCQRSNLKKATIDSNLLGASSIRLSADTVETTSNTATTHFKWEHFADVTAQDGILVLWVGKSFGFDGVIIPIDAFGNEQTSQAFFNFAKDHI